MDQDGLNLGLGVGTGTGTGPEGRRFFDDIANIWQIQLDEA